jgi:hypothetical protein
MRTLAKGVEVANLYHHWMGEFDALKNENAFMKAKLVIYQ